MDLLELLLAHLNALNASVLQPFLRLWPAQPVAPAAATAPQTLPVLAYLPAMTANAAPAGAAVARSLQSRAPTLTWRQTYGRGELDPAFFDNYAWTELLVHTPEVSGESLACGALLLGPYTLYPQHRHIPEEIYVPLSGAARWRQGDALWRTQPPGGVIHHARDEPHAMQTGTEPLLAIYLWRGGDLSRPARLDDATDHAGHKELSI